MLRCTPAAATTLREVRERNAIPDAFGIRVFPATSPDGSTGLGIGFADEPEAGDAVTEQHGTTLIVAGELAERLDGLTLDVVPDPGANGETAPRLVLRPAEG